LFLPGKQHGHLAVPYSYNMGGWANLLIPITVLQNGVGRTALVLAGNHGDEYPGPVAILKLMRELQAAQVQGRIILIPALNFPAVKAGQRLSPLDGKNMNRAFPGTPNGTMTEIIAHYLTTVLFPLADIVIDIHTGGRSLDFVPCATMHLVDDPLQRREMMGGVEAWNSDYCFVYADIAGTGLLPVEAERQGKIVVTTEMGGGECVHTNVHRLTQSGLRNVLIHYGVLRGEPVSREQSGAGPLKWVQAIHRDNYRFAPESGLYEGMVALGEPVEEGQTLGQIHFLECPEREPVPVIAKTSGILLATRGPSMVNIGDCVATIVQEVDPASW